MTVIDSQVHAYEANTPKRPWHSVPNWPPHVTGDEMVAAMRLSSIVSQSVFRLTHTAIAPAPAARPEAPWR